MRTTVDFGIDLGTTNSAIALSKGPQVEVFKNSEGEECTPSAVHVDKKGRLIVGREAKERLETDAENAFSEFKLQMGTERDYTFTRSGRRMRPEELSSEVLKSLRADVKQHIGRTWGRDHHGAGGVPGCRSAERRARRPARRAALQPAPPGAGRRRAPHTASDRQRSGLLAGVRLRRQLRRRRRQCATARQCRTTGAATTATS
jgi:hypothetical protein